MDTMSHFTSVDAKKEKSRVSENVASCGSVRSAFLRPFIV